MVVVLYIARFPNWHVHLEVQEQVGWGTWQCYCCCLVLCQCPRLPALVDNNWWCIIERADTGRRLQVITYQEIALPPLRRTGAPAMRGGADQFDPCCYFHHVRLVRQAISWLVITSNLLPVPALSIIHHQLLPTRAGNALQSSSRCRSRVLESSL